jgi:hypothetical protein
MDSLIEIVRLCVFELATSLGYCRFDSITYQRVLMATEFACAGKASFGQACLEDLTPYDGRQTE